ncbi:hypothetical protein ACF8GB_01680 [Pseudomonas sp. xss_4]|uniref:hypothetical protein n=1 Tax=Pseudomonas sp. xss_4 TaxID=3367216 RepID=UPI00370C2112
MKTFPKDEQAKKICWDWAEDFKSMGMVGDYMFWQSIGLAFDSGASVHDTYIITKINKSIRIKIEASRMGPILPKSLGKALIEIGREAKYLEMVMTHTFG